MASEDFREADLKEIYDRAHPKLDITSYRLDDVLDPALDAEMRAYSEKHGYDYDWFKQRFEASHQIIPPRQTGPFSVELARKGVVPLNKLNRSFRLTVMCSIEERALLTSQK